MGSFRRYPLFIALVLLFFIVQLVPLNNEYKIRESRFSKVVLLLTYLPQKGINNLSRFIVDRWYRYVDNVSTHDENKKLKKELWILREANFQLFEMRLQNQRLRRLVQFDLELPFKLIAANIIGSSPSPLKSQIIIIDKGSDHGLVEGMPVKAYDGIVGRIYIVGEKSSEVMLITDPLSSLDAYVHRSRARGIVKGLGKLCFMDYLEKNSDIMIGDKIVTSGKDGFFPRGMLVGTVSEVYSKGVNLNAKIQPNIDIRSVEEVLVINKLSDHIVVNE